MSDKDDAEVAEPVADRGGTELEEAATAQPAKPRRGFSLGRLVRPAPKAGSGSDAAPGDSQGSKPRSSTAPRPVAIQLDPRERRFGYFAGAFVAILTLTVAIPYLAHHNHTTTDLKTVGAAHVFLVEGLVLAVFLVVGAHLKRRTLLGFAGVAVGIWLIEIPSLRLFGLAYAMFGMWLLIKGLRGQQAAAQGNRRPPARPPRPTRRSRKKDQGPPTQLRNAPQPNKRYTPPKPTHRPAAKKPTSSRAEQRKGSV
jgi:hypothetical protein